jgi:hypothetical protein
LVVRKEIFKVDQLLGAPLSKDLYHKTYYGRNLWISVIS